ncbi:hypothetical protein S83_066236 [Arachis hypogaea]|uniref:Uncharacterized protein n=1 Tax=Arachis hypogaea TaxID=3818 RepID=A0A6B9V9L5_ARAHY|nr:uncharacterized protein LOC112779866 [Arachis hypogaea]QHN77381.1 uncharacterized protein DS421_19g652210 [Arachis hypogaea]
MDKFLTIEVKDHNMVEKQPCFPPVKLPLDIKPSVVVEEVIDLCDESLQDNHFFEPLLKSPTPSSCKKISNDWLNKSPTAEFQFGQFFYLQNLFNDINVVQPSMDFKLLDTFNDYTDPCFDPILYQSDPDPIKQVLSLTECTSPKNNTSNHYESQTFGFPISMFDTSQLNLNTSISEKDQSIRLSPVLSNYSIEVISQPGSPNN